MWLGNLFRANLSDANLRSASLPDTFIKDGNLSGADLLNANLRRSDLTSANFTGATFSPPPPEPHSDVGSATPSALTLSLQKQVSMAEKELSKFGLDLRDLRDKAVDLTDACAALPPKGWPEELEPLPRCPPGKIWSEMLPIVGLR